MRWASTFTPFAAIAASARASGSASMSPMTMFIPASANR
jgi:hypothetical protein